MTEQRISSHTADTDSQLRSLYHSAFPAEEQVPWKDLVRLIDEMPLDFTAYYDNEDGRFIGFTIVYPYKEYNWFWYFAVSESLRGQGYGQQILSRLIARYSNRTIILDMESPSQLSDNIAQRQRRLAFYSRNGFRDTHAHRTFDGIEYTIMMLGRGNFTTSDYDAIISNLQRFWQPPQPADEER